MSKSAPYGSLTRGAIQRLPRRLPRRPIRQARGGGFVGSVTFPSTRLVVRVLIALGADLAASPLRWAWEDITAYVRYDPAINIEVGRPDEQSTVVPGRMALRLDNRDARFTRRNPTSPYYGLLSMNTPIWVTVDPGSGVVTRAEMFVNEWPNRWPDKSANDCVVTVECAGVLRRLQQGSVPKSALYRSILSNAPVQYWPAEDGPEVAALGASAVRGQPLTTLGVTFGSVSDLVGSQPTPSVGTGRLVGSISGGSATAWWAVFHIETAFVAPVIVRWYTTATAFGVYRVSLPSVAGDSVSVAITDVLSTVTTILDGTIVDASWENTWHTIGITSEQSGSNVVTRLYVDGTLQATDTTAGSLGSLTQFLGNPSAETITSIAHIAAGDGTTLPNADAAGGYVGEQAHVRLARLCTEEGVPVETLASTSQTMGPQAVGALLPLLRDCEAVGGGVLYEKRWGLAYLSSAERYNQPVGLALDFSAGHVAEIPEPTDDDQRVRNRWTISRTDGSTYTAEETTGPMGTGTDGPGVYDDSKTLNVETDDQLPHQAGWRVHLGTVDEDRWPRLDINLTRNPSLIPSWLALPWGARTTAANPPATMPPDPIDAIIEGYGEHIDPILWTANLVTAPSSPYEVFTVEQASTNRGRIDSGDSFLLADADSTTTTLTVDGSLPWSTNTAGLDLGIGGERVTVGSVASYAADTFTRVTANGWGTGESGGSWLTNGGAASEYSTSGTTGVHAPTAASSTRITHQQLGILDSRSLLDVRAPAIATGAEIRMGRLCRYTSASFFYHVLICWQTDSTVDLTINSRVNGTDTELVRVEGLGTYASGDWWRLLVDVRGTTVRAMAWNTSAVKPILWQASVTNTSLYTAGSVGVRTFLAAGNTNTLPLTCEYDNNDVQLPQTFTVTRSANTVVKSQTANTKVSLWRPAVVGL